MTYRELKNEVSSIIDGQINLLIIGLWINRVIEDIASRAVFDFNLAEATIDLVAGTEVANLPSDFDKEVIMTYGTGTDTIVLDYEPYYLFAQRDRTVASTNTPVRYTTRGKSGTAGTMEALFNPIPNAAAGTADATLVYVKQTLALSADADEPELPDNKHHLIILGTLVRCYQYLGKQTEYAAMKNEFEQGLLTLITSESNRGKFISGPRP